MQDSGCQVSGLVHPSVCELQKLSFGAGHGPFRFLWWERWSNPRFILWWAAFCRSVLRSGNSILKGAFLVIPTKVSNLAFSVTEEEVRQICREIVNTNHLAFPEEVAKSVPLVHHLRWREERGNWRPLSLEVWIPQRPLQRSFGHSKQRKAAVNSEITWKTCAGYWSAIAGLWTPYHKRLFRYVYIWHLSYSMLQPVSRAVKVGRLRTAWSI